MLPANGRDALVRLVVGSELPCVPCHDGLFEFGDAACRCISGEVVLDRPNASLLDSFRRREIRLPCAERDNVYTGPLQAARFGGYGHRCGFANAAHAIREGHDYSLPVLTGGAQQGPQPGRDVRRYELLYPTAVAADLLDESGA